MEERGKEYNSKHTESEKSLRHRFCVSPPLQVYSTQKNQSLKNGQPHKQCGKGSILIDAYIQHSVVMLLMKFWCLIGQLWNQTRKYIICTHKLIAQAQTMGKLTQSARRHHLCAFSASAMHVGTVARRGKGERKGGERKRVGGGRERGKRGMRIVKDRENSLIIL